MVFFIEAGYGNVGWRFRGYFGYNDGYFLVSIILLKIGYFLKNLIIICKIYKNCCLDNFLVRKIFSYKLIILCFLLMFNIIFIYRFNYNMLL